MEDNIDTVYAYLNGETDELVIDFESEPVKERVLTEVEDDVEDLEPTDLPMPNAEAIEAMAESESEFEDRREAFRAEQKQRIQEETEEELSDEELERILDDRMDQYRQEARNDVETEVENELEGAPAELTDPIVDLQMARIDALTGELTYEEYTTEVDTATDDLGDAVVSVFETRLDEELPEPVDVTNQLGQQQRDQLETARTVVSASGPVAYGLAVLAIVVAGIVAWLAPLEIAAIEIGVISAIVGAVGAVGSSVATDPVRTAIQDAGAPMGFESFVQAFVVGILRTLQWQSVLLVVVGVVLVAVGIALRREYIELPERYAGS
jgi:type IV secretory pathway VirB2 component (pilin)